MELNTIMQLIASGVGFIGSIFFAIGIIRQTTDAMAKQCGTYFDYNPHAIKATASQKADYIVGGVFICLSFFIQFISYLIPTKFSGFLFQKHYVFLLIIVSLPSLYGILNVLAKKLTNSFERKIQRKIEGSIQQGTWG